MPDNRHDGYPALRLRSPGRWPDTQRAALILTSAILHQRYHHRFRAISGHTPLMVNDGIRNIQTAWFDASV